jgi:hypothetical protein
MAQLLNRCTTYVEISILNVTCTALHKNLVK